MNGMNSQLKYASCLPNTIYYFNMRARAEGIRYLLAQVGSGELELFKKHPQFVKYPHSYTIVHNPMTPDAMGNTSLLADNAFYDFGHITKRKLWSLTGRRRL
jgi:hypothetical protein